MTAAALGHRRDGAPLRLPASASRMQPAPPAPSLVAASSCWRCSPWPGAGSTRSSSALPRVRRGWVLLGARRGAVRALAGRRTARDAAPAAAPRRRRASGCWRWRCAGSASPSASSTSPACPAGMNHDAAFNGMYALHVLQGAPYTPYVSAAWGRETLFMYLCTRAGGAGSATCPSPSRSPRRWSASPPCRSSTCSRARCAARAWRWSALALLAVSGWHDAVQPRRLAHDHGAAVRDAGAARAVARRSRPGAGATGCWPASARRWRSTPTTPAAWCRRWWRRCSALFTLLDRARWRERAARRRCSAWRSSSSSARRCSGTRPRTSTSSRRAPRTWPRARSRALRGLLAIAGRRGDVQLPRQRQRLLHRRAAARAADRRRCSASACWCVVSGARRRADLFLLTGFALALLPGVLASPNGNRCIIALPFVYVISRAAALVALGRRGRRRARRRRRRARAGARAIVAGGRHRRRRDLPRVPRRAAAPDHRASPPRRRRRASTCAASARHYTRYVIAEDWPEYTLAYLSYNGGGTPLENHYVLGRQPGGHRGAHQPLRRARAWSSSPTSSGAGRAALERLRAAVRRASRRADHRHASGRRAGRHGADRRAADRRHTPVCGPTPPARSRSAATRRPRRLRCFAPVGDDARRLAAPPAHACRSATIRGRSVPWRCSSRCPAGPGGSRCWRSASAPRPRAARRAIAAALARPWSALDAGRWYEVVVSLQPDGARCRSRSTVSRRRARPGRSAARGRRASPASASARPGRGQFFVDDLAVAAGHRRSPATRRWAAVRARRTHWRASARTSRRRPIGQLCRGDGWRSAERSGRGPAGSAAPAPTPPVAAAGCGATPSTADAATARAVRPAGRNHRRPDRRPVYVADKNNHRIQKFARDGEFLLAWGRAGHAPGRVPRAARRRGGRRIRLRRRHLEPARAGLRPQRPARCSPSPAQPSLSSPRGVFAAGKRIYVAEAGGGRVTVYDRAGALQQTIGSLGDGPGQLVEPVDVAVDSHGDVWVVNGGNNRLEHFAADGTRARQRSGPGLERHGPQGKLSRHRRRRTRSTSATGAAARSAASAPTAPSCRRSAPACTSPRAWPVARSHPRRVARR